MRKYFDALISGFTLFWRKKVSILAAASSFYVVLGFVPLSLLVIRGLGMALGNTIKTEAKLFEIFRNLYPEINTHFLLKIQKLVEGPLYAAPNLTLMNLAFLIIASLSFTDSIWNGLAIITQDKAKSVWIKLKSIFIIIVTVIFLTVMLVIPPFLRFIGNLAKDNFLVSTIKNYFPESIGVLENLRHIETGLNFLVQSNFTFFILLLVYFTFLYRYLFHWKIKIKDAFFAAFIFVGALSLGRFGFYIYFNTFRKTLENNYGDYYSVFVSLIWIFLLMAFFFYGACLCFILEKQINIKEFRKSGIN